MLRHMLKPPAAPPQQLLTGDIILLFILGAAVPEPLERQPVQLAIFPLIRIATALALQVGPPERFQFPALPGRHSWHDRPPPSQNLS